MYITEWKMQKRLYARKCTIPAISANPANYEKASEKERRYVAVCCSVLQCVAVCCSVLQCVAVCCSVLQWNI